MDVSDLQHAEGDALAGHLVDAGVKPAHLRSARRFAKFKTVPLAEALRTLGLATSEQLARAAAKAASLRYMTFGELLGHDYTSVTALRVESPLAGLPLALERDTLLIAVPDENAHVAPEFLSYKLERRIASLRALRHAYRRVFANTEKIYRDLAGSVQAREKEVQAAEAPELGESYPKLLIALLRHACYTGASDLQLHNVDDTGIVRLVVDGVGQTFDVISAVTAEKLYYVALRWTGKNENELQKEIFGDASFAEAGLDDDVVRRELNELRNEYDFRMNFGRAKSGYTVTIRFLARDAETQEFEQLGFDERDQVTILRALASNSGLVVVTGPTGSSKTTTRYAMLSRIDPEERSVQTIENPVEYTNAMWMQYEIKGSDSEETGTDKVFHGMLRNAPRVVDVAEVRSPGAVATMMRASATGHLVFTTLHADDAPLAVYMLRTLGVSDQDLATNLQIVIAVRLARRLCPSCRVPEDDAQRIEQAKELAEDAGEGEFDVMGGKLFKPNINGCGHCSMGYRGRFMLYELLEVKTDLANLLREGAPASRIREVGIESGRSLRDRGWHALRDGKTSAEELARVLPRRRY